MKTLALVAGLCSIHNAASFASVALKMIEICQQRPSYACAGMDGCRLNAYVCLRPRWFGRERCEWERFDLREPLPRDVSQHIRPAYDPAAPPHFCQTLYFDSRCYAAESDVMSVYQGFAVSVELYDEEAFIGSLSGSQAFQSRRWAQPVSTMELKGDCRAQREAGLPTLCLSTRVQLQVSRRKRWDECEEGQGAPPHPLDTYVEAVPRQPPRLDPIDRSGGVFQSPNTGRLFA